MVLGPGVPIVRPFIERDPARAIFR